MNIVCFGQKSWELCWGTEQRLLARLARRGHRVLFVDPAPNGDTPSPKGNAIEMRDVQDGLHVLTPQRQANQRSLRRAVTHTAEKLGLWAPAVICLSPAQWWLVDAVDPAARVYFARSDFAAVNDAELARLELEALRQCDIALAVAPSLVRRFKQIQPTTYLQENGADVESLSPFALAGYDAHPQLAPLPRPRLGFVGQVDERLDQDLLVRVATTFSGASVILAGRISPGTDVSRLKAHRNIVFTEALDYRQLGSVYRELDLGLVPFVDSPQTQAGNPIKTYEYLAAGLPVVATDLGGLNSARQAVALAKGHEQFIAAIDQELSDPDRLSDQRRLVAESSSWQRRADQIEDRLSEALVIASEKRRRYRKPEPRPDRHGRQVVRVEPRLDGKDASVRLLHNRYLGYSLSRQQHVLYLLSRVAGLAYYAVRRVGRLLKGDLTAVKRILVVRNGHLGDTVVFLPTLAALRRGFPKAKICVALAPGSGARPLLEASPYVNDVLPLDFFNRSRRDRFWGAARLLARGFDLTVGGAWYFHLPEAVFSGAPLRLGLYDGHPLQRYADRVVMLDPILHEAENNLQLAELVTGPSPSHERVPRLDLDEQELAERAKRVRSHLGIAAEAPVVAMHPGSKRPSRRWPPECFAELAAGLLAERGDLHVVFTGVGAEEQELIASIQAMIPLELQSRTHNSVGISDLLGIVGFYDSCKLLVCNDTGVMHVARARGVPLVAIIGPENDRRWGPHPLGPGVAVSVRNQVPGTPHGKWDCPWSLSLRSIDAGRIKRHCDAILDGTFAARHELAPLLLGDEMFYPLVRDVRRLSFAQLQELGLILPKVAVILSSNPALLGSDSAPVPPKQLAVAARAMRRQHYPAAQTLVIIGAETPLEEQELGNAQVLRVRRGDPDAAWSVILAQSKALLFWPCSATSTYGPTDLSQRVAEYLRGPHATVVDGERAWPARKLLGNNLFSGHWLIERAALEELLIHPLPVHEPEAAVTSDVLDLVAA